METKPPSPPSANQQDISFQVMPEPGRAPSSSSSVPMPPSPSSNPPRPAHPSSGASKTAYIVIAVIVLLLLAGLAYYFLGFNKPSNNPSTTTNTSKLSGPFLNKYFASNLDTNGNCSDQTVCGDTVDSDKDGLTNYQELTAGTDPTMADTDKDGLADGDEVNVYGTKPANAFTDTRDVARQNGYNDGVSIKNGYDPTTPGSKFTDTKKTAIAANIKKYTLHEPTKTTLNVNSDGTPVTQSNSSQQTQGAQTDNTTSTQSTGSQTATHSTVLIQDFAFSPQNITVKKGTTVTWTNKDVMTHTVTSDTGIFDSGNLAQNKSFSHTFDVAGLFTYHCSVHPDMTGSVIVQ